MNLASFRKSANCYLSSKARRAPAHPAARKQAPAIAHRAVGGRVVPSSITLTGSAMQNGFLNQAQVEFDLSGSNLTVTLTNTATQTFNSTNTLDPTNVLTGVLFDIAGNTSLGALTPGNANLASGSHMLTTGSSPTTSTIDTSASGWGTERQPAAPSTANTTASKLSGALARPLMPILPTVTLPPIPPWTSTGLTMASWGRVMSAAETVASRACITRTSRRLKCSISRSTAAHSRM